VLAALAATLVVGAASPASAAIILHGPTPVAQITPAHRALPAGK
jgi:hypothetical protein